MKKAMRTVTAAVAISLACVGALQAHHSAGMFELLTPVWLEGTVVRFDRINPHSIITVEEKTQNGMVRRWGVEGPDAGQLNRRGIALDFLKTGDVVRLCGFPLKEEFLGRRPSRADGVDQFVHGHVLVKADGSKSIWGSYGTLSACIQSSAEPRQAWLAVLNSDERIREAWCTQRNRAPLQSSASLRAFVDEFTSLLARPCNLDRR